MPLFDDIVKETDKLVKNYEEAINKCMQDEYETKSILPDKLQPPQEELSENIVIAMELEKIAAELRNGDLSANNCKIRIDAKYNNINLREVFKYTGGSRRIRKKITLYEVDPNRYIDKNINGSEYDE